MTVIQNSFFFSTQILPGKIRKKFGGNQTATKRMNNQFIINVRLCSLLLDFMYMDEMMCSCRIHEKQILFENLKTLFG